MTRRPSPALAAAALVVSAAGAGVLATTPAAGAAMCSGGSGVNVVVDFTNNPDGGGPTSSCDPAGAGKDGSRVFTTAGYALAYATQQPGFVCRINGKASSDPCVNASPTDAYWGLFWSDGSDGRWHYASTGVASVSVPAGGSLAFVWQNGGGTDLPPYPAPRQARSPSPQPTPTQPSSPDPTSAPAAPTDAGTSLPSQAPTPAGPAPTSTRSASPTAQASTKAPPRRKRTRHPEEQSPTTPAAPTVTATAEDVSAAPAQEQADAGLPAWVVLAVLGGLGAAAAAAVVLRRRS